MLTLIQKTFFLLAPEDRRKTLLLCLVMVASAALEVMSVMAVMPFMAVMLSSDGGRSLKVVQWLHHWLAIPNDTQFTLVVGSFTVGLLMVSAVLSSITRNALLTFTHTQYHTLAQRLFSHYLHLHYAFFLSNTSSVLSEAVIVDCETIVSKVFLGLMTIFSNAVIASGIVLAMLAMAPLMAMWSFSVVAGLYLATYGLLRRRVLLIGIQRKAVNELHIATVHQSFHSIKEIKLFGAEHYFITRHFQHSLDKANTTGRAVALAELPRKVIETIAIGSALGIMLLFAATGRRVDDLIPMVSLFVFATYRLLPAAQQMYQHLLKVRFCTPTVEHVYAELHGEADHILGDAAQSKGNLSTQNLAGDIFLDAVSYRYPQAEALALDAVNLRIPVGSVVAFVGATGSGKSTAAGLLMGLLSPTAGRLRVGDQAIDAHNVRQWQQRVGYVPQAIALLDDTVTSNIAFGTSQPSSARIAGAAEVAQIQSFIQDRLPDGLATRVGENGVRLSGGERQRLGIARALYRDPTLLVLDEATSALDNQTERAVIEGIHAMSGQRTVVMVAHRLNTIRHCDWIFYFDRGKLIAEGRFGDLLTNCVGFANLVQSAGESYEAAA